MKVNIKILHPNAVTPKYASEGDAGIDLVAVTMNHSEKYGFMEFGTGIAIEIPKGYVGLLFPRSSISKTSATLANSVGVIDSSYRGEIKLRFFANSADIASTFIKAGVIKAPIQPQNTDYKIGDKVGQLIIIPYPHIELEAVESLSNTDRGERGFGSTGN